MRVDKALFLLVLTICISSFFVAGAKTKAKTVGLSIADRTEYVNTSDGRQLYVSALTPGKDCAVIFAHGLLESSQVWFQQYINWLPECSTVVYDIYGHGLSLGILPKRDNSVQIYDITAILNWVNASSVVMVGHDYGGVGIQSYIQKKPNDKRIKGIVLVDSLSRNPNPFRQSGDIPVVKLLASTTYQQLPLINAAKAIISPALPRDLGNGGWEIIAGSIEICNMKAANQIILTNVSFVHNSFTKPVLIIYGAFDNQFGPGNWKELQSSYKGSKLSSIENAGHAPHLQEPDEFNAVLQPFLKQVLP